MNKLDLDYQALLKDILENGVEKNTRNGKVLSVFGRQIRHKMSSGLFDARDEGTKEYTSKIALIPDNKLTNRIKFSIPEQNLVEGKYTISVYNNGYKIGENTVVLKKGWFLSKIF
jgi:thymidylate synthase